MGEKESTWYQDPKEGKWKRAGGNGGGEKQLISRDDALSSYFQV
jgi:hypothetical protein